MKKPRKEHGVGSHVYTFKLFWEVVDILDAVKQHSIFRGSRSGAFRYIVLDWYRRVMDDDDPIIYSMLELRTMYRKSRATPEENQEA
jgi:hypothetical protein